MKLQRRLKMIGMIVLCYFLTSFAQNYGWVKMATLGSSLQTVEFIDSLHGWAADGATQIFRTTDGGITWTQYGSTVGFAVKGISFADSLNGWCVGVGGLSSGEIIHTSDGGKTWALQQEKFPRQYVGTKALSKTKNITSGNTHTTPPDTGVILQTLDAGKTWTEQRMADTIGALGKMQFLDSLHGYIYAYHILKTTDGGLSWKVLPGIAQIQVATFLDSLRGWGGYQSSMYHTTDGGVIWQFQAYLDQPEQLTMQSMCFVDSLKGWVFGYSAYFGTITESIFRTTDGGITWKNESIGITGDFDYVVDAKMFNAHSGIAVCGKGSVLKYQVVTSVVEKHPDLPHGFALYQNYPNPFNPSTTIEYEISKRTHVKLIVYNIAGEEVQELVNQRQDVGRYRAKFDAKGLPSGTYFYTLTCNAASVAKKLTVLK